MREQDVVDLLQQNFSSLFPSLTLLDWQTGPPADLQLRVAVGQSRAEKRLLCEVKARGEPRILREAGYQLQQYLTAGARGYPVVVTPYVSDRGRQVCKEIGISFLDLSGNALLDLGDFYFEVEGKPNSYKASRSLKSLFQGRSERVLRALLTDPKRRWTLRELAAEVGISLGYASEIAHRLDEQEWVERSRTGGLRLVAPTDLLDRWREEYTYRRSPITELYGLGEVADLERAVADYCREQGTNYAFTLFSGANLVAPFTRYLQIAFYFSGHPATLQERLGFKPVSSGANVLVLRPYDVGVFHGAQQVRDRRVVGNIQLYLDLYGYKGRGREQAEFLREQVIGF
ncbi:MAG: type IV toxin-antitoxin system AbiEi family antitoxin [Anaerolineae bacterium]